MFTISEVKELIKLLDSTNVSELELENEGTKLSIKKNNHATVYTGSQSTLSNTQSIEPSRSVEPNFVVTEEKSATVQVAVPAATQSAAQTATVDTNIIEIVSPMVGTFYASPAPDAESYVKVGDRVNAKDVICIVEAMKLMNEIEAECNGVIVAVCVEDGQLVEYGQTLFKVSKE